MAHDKNLLDLYPELRSGFCFAIVASIDSSLPTTEDAHQILGVFLSRYSEADAELLEVCRRNEAGASLTHFRREWATADPYDLYDPADTFGSYARRQAPGARILASRIASPDNTSRTYMCAFVFPQSSSRPRFRRLDQEIPSAGQIDTGRWGRDVKPEVSRRADVRCLLGCRGFDRTLTIAAGSPSWDTAGLEAFSRLAEMEFGMRLPASAFAPKMQEPRQLLQESVSRVGNSDGLYGRSRNDGTLDAVWNDFNALLGALVACSKDMRLPGLTWLGLLTQSDDLRALLGLLNISTKITTDNHGSMLRRLPHLPGTFYNNWIYNSALPGPNVGMRNTVIANRPLGDGEWELDDDSLIVPRTFEPEHGAHGKSYALFFYAGHGSPSGALTISGGELVQPEAVFEFSCRAKVPLFIFLDMCHSQEFGERYETLMRRHRFPGLVVGATDASEKAYENPRMRVVPRSAYPMRLQNNPGDSRGVFSAAFCFALRVLRNVEQQQGRAIRLSVDDFVHQLVGPICGLLATSFGTPTQVPALFSL